MVDGTINSEDQERRLQEYISENTQYEGLVISIEDDITDSAWAEFFADVNTKRKERETWFEEIKRPLNEALKLLNTKEHQACDRLREVEGMITQARGNWLRTKRAAIAESNKKAMEEASAGGTGVAMIAPKPTQTVFTSTGASVGLRSQPSWRLTDDKEITAKHVEREKMEFDRSDPRLKNVPDKLFVLKKGMIMAAIKMGDMPVSEHSIEKFEDFASTTK